MLSKKEVIHIAKLARLGLAEKEISRLQKELSLILDYFEVLKTADVSEVKVSPVNFNIFRKDETLISDKELVSKSRPEGEDEDERSSSTLTQNIEKGYFKVKSPLKR